MRKLAPTLLLFDLKPITPLFWASGSPLRLQGLLLLYGAYLAGLTDHVSSPPVNQSLTIMVGVNLVVLAAGLLFVVTRYLHSWPNLVFGLTSGGIFVCTTTINCFIFIPQVCSKVDLARLVLLVTPEALLGMIMALCVFCWDLWLPFTGESEESRFQVSWLPLFFLPGSPEGRYLCSWSARWAGQSGRSAAAICLHS